ncbi:unnamed protein product [Effrenium voratum]|nr:unnamed protein product [Effrenium voratum]
MLRLAAGFKAGFQLQVDFPWLLPGKFVNSPVSWSAGVHGLPAFWDPTVRQLGAELFCCGLPEHDQKLTELLREDVSGTVVLFPSDLALPAAELAALGDTEPRVRRVVVLDGGWAQCKKMNQWLDPALPRCFVNASREEFGGTRRYRGITNRVQTAGAFVALMRDLEEEPETVAAISESLGAFMDSFVAQMHEGRLKVL